MLIRLNDLSNRTFACAYSGNFDPYMGGRWQWIAEEVAAQFKCDVDDVSTTDTEDELDLILVSGKPVARIVKQFGMGAT